MSQRGQCICGHSKWVHTINGVGKCTANTPHPWRAACPCKAFFGAHPDEQDQERK